MYSDRQDMNDLSLPNPVRGKLCGANSCYEAAASKLVYDIIV